MQDNDPVSTVLGGPGVSAIETHGSRVFLHADDVFKVKKPVRFPFLDYTTLEQRQHACEEELRVNQRSSPHVYLGVRALVRPPGGQPTLLETGAEIPEGADVLEWVVHMRRMPDEHRCDHRLERGDLNVESIQRIAAFLAEFHHKVDSDHEGFTAALRKNVFENLESLEPHARTILGKEATDRLRSHHLEMFERAEPLLEKRQAEGRVVDGHGDFRLEHVYLDEGGRVTLLDAIEFDRSFRVADVSADVAFFVMDLDSRGRTDLGEAFLAAYAHESGDHDVYALVDFYASYWALVRAKVDAVRAQQLEGEGCDELTESCARRLFLASHLVDGAQRSPVIFGVMGLIASGKSRVARKLGETIAAPVISSDRVRKQLADRAPTENLGSDPYEGEYSESKTRAVYDELLRRAELIAESGRPVVLDASFQDLDARRRVAEVAEHLGIPHLFIECRAPQAEIEARLARRAGRQHDSDARAPLLEQFQSHYPPWDETSDPDHVTIDTTLPRAQVDQEVLRLARSVRRPSRQLMRVSIGRRAGE